MSKPKKDIDKGRVCFLEFWGLEGSRQILSQFSCLIVSNSLQPHELQHARLPVHHQLPEFTQTHVH